MTGTGEDKERVAAVETRVYESDGHFLHKRQWVVEERAVTLSFNGREMVTLLCAGHHLDELAVGFFYAEGFIKNRDEIIDLKIDKTQGTVDLIAATDCELQEKLWHKRTITSGCGKGTLFYNALDALLSHPVRSSLRLPPEAVRARMRELNTLSHTYRRTHGVHNTALATRDAILLFRDDIGRHNAVDMIVGHSLISGLALEDKLLLTTGRLTSEILIKVAKVGIPVLVSRNTATTLAIRLARRLDITLIGYVRSSRFTIYNDPDRVQNR